MEIIKNNKNQVLNINEDVLGVFEEILEDEKLSLTTGKLVVKNLVIFKKQKAFIHYDLQALHKQRIPVALKSEGKEYVDCWLSEYSDEVDSTEEMSITPKATLIYCFESL